LPTLRESSSSPASPALLNDEGYIETDAAACRVDEAGSRVYALGDVASFSQNYTLDAYAAVPVVQANLQYKLIPHELRLASPYDGDQDPIDVLTDEIYVREEKNGQLCSITRFGGLGMSMGIALTSLLMHKMKGSDYRVRKTSEVVVSEGNPYAKPGNKYE
jgi:NADH dehydrogenase FAD-containing subunit